MSIFKNIVNKIVPVAAISNAVSNITKKEEPAQTTPTTTTAPTTTVTTAESLGKVSASDIAGTVMETIGTAGQEVIMDTLDAFLETEEGKKVRNRVIYHYFKELWYILVPLLLLAGWGLISLLKLIVQSFKSNKR